MNLKEQYHLVYKTSTTPVFPVCLIAAAFSGRFEELTDRQLKPHKVFLIVKDGVVSFFFDRDLKSSAEILFEDTEKFLSTVKTREKIVAEELLEQTGANIEEFFTDGRLNDQGEKKLENLFRTITSYGCITDGPGFLFQVHLEGRIDKEIEDLGLSDTEEMLHYLFSSHKLTNYERFLLALHDVIDENKAASEVAKQYFWVVHDYLGDIVDEKYVKQKIEEFLEDDDLDDHIKAAKERIMKIREMTDKLPENLKDRVRHIQEILYIYNERKKEVLSKINIFIRRIIEHKFNNGSMSDLKKIYQLSPQELLLLLRGESIPYEERSRKWCYEIFDRKMQPGPEECFTLIAERSERTILKGHPASRGKAKGTARIILNVSHMHKFQKGDILVAPFTNVNYLPIMRKSAAILTETGGTTSHAAVVSRELGIPCIVGIEDLLLTLRDGEQVEVNAANGIVRKL